MHTAWHALRLIRGREGASRVDETASAVILRRRLVEDCARYGTTAKVCVEGWGGVGVGGGGGGGEEEGRGREEKEDLWVRWSFPS